jgi:hypothetical protein
MRETSRHESTPVRRLRPDAHVDLQLLTAVTIWDARITLYGYSQPLSIPHAARNGRANKSTEWGQVVRNHCEPEMIAPRIRAPSRAKLERAKREYTAVAVQKQLFFGDLRAIHQTLPIEKQSCKMANSIAVVVFLTGNDSAEQFYLE